MIANRPLDLGPLVMVPLGNRTKAFVISPAGRRNGIVEASMNRASFRDAKTRPPRVKLAGTVLSMLRLENGRHVRGKLHMLSTTGGLLHLQSALDEAIRVEVVFHVGTCTVRNPARMLFPMWATQGCLQPFEFLSLPEPECERLRGEIDAMIACRTAQQCTTDAEVPESAAMPQVAEPAEASFVDDGSSAAFNLASDTLPVSSDLD
jgi:hypothetical protein